MRPWGLLPAHAVAVEGRPVSSRAHATLLHHAAEVPDRTQSAPCASRLWHRRQRRTGGSAPFVARVQTRQGCNADIKASPSDRRTAVIANFPVLEEPFCRSSLLGDLISPSLNRFLNRWSVNPFLHNTVIQPLFQPGVNPSGFRISLRECLCLIGGRFAEARQCSDVDSNIQHPSIASSSQHLSTSSSSPAYFRLSMFGTESRIDQHSSIGRVKAALTGSRAASRYTNT